ncbi:MAG: VCBS repeat-containing protein [Nannocystaceae bacterium]|nr:VCBS repeat-containing protein [Nannocystaceae bacterium]
MTALSLASASACGSEGGQGSGTISTGADASATLGGSATDASSSGGNGSTGGSASASTGEGSGTGSTKLDVGFGSDGGDSTGVPPPSCKVQDDMDAIGDCSTRAPADSFAPEQQWSWSGPDGNAQSSVTPLVANFTDDDGNGEIDLCDVPDVVVVLGDGAFAPGGQMWLLDGATGTPHFEFAADVNGSVTPAIGDIDGDGLPEVVTMDSAGLIAFEHDGSVAWQAPTPSNSNFFAVALADLDNDGDVEIVVGNFVADHTGATEFAAPDYFWNAGDAIYLSATAAADLDDDGDLEVVMGRSAWHHDGSNYYQVQAQVPGYPQIADLDDDAQPEVLVTSTNGLTVLEHDGAVKYQDLRPTGDAPGYNWYRPATVHDFDGDGVREYATSSATHYSVFEADASIVWTADVAEFSCCAAGTAFDFLGDGVAEAMYADETTMWTYDGNTGAVLVNRPRSSWTNIEYPVVVDVDNDGSAEILVVSNNYQGMTAPTIEVFRDAEDRWIQPRRIWNQHTYHVTNVREDATIPQFEQPSWTLLNTYRTNAQIEGGGVCNPVPEG